MVLLPKEYTNIIFTQALAEYLSDCMIVRELKAKYMNNMNTKGTTVIEDCNIDMSKPDATKVAVAEAVKEGMKALQGLGGNSYGIYVESPSGGGDWQVNAACDDYEEPKEVPDKFHNLYEKVSEAKFILKHFQDVLCSSLSSDPNSQTEDKKYRYQLTEILRALDEIEKIEEI